MIIEAYTGDPTRFNPTLLTAAASSKTQIGLNWSGQLSGGDGL